MTDAALLMSRCLMVKKTDHSIGYETGGAVEYDGVEFVMVDDELEDPSDVAPAKTATQLVIGHDLWLDLGSPSEITVAIEGGDKLNVE